jgi:UDP-N-acetylglucosamine 2-epimerase (non-hydrolysing)
MKRVLCLFGTRPEIIKLAPVLRALESRREQITALHVASSQHEELLHPLARELGVRIDHDLKVMEEGQSPARVAARVLHSLDDLIAREDPQLLLVQGDTTTAMAGALAAFLRGVPVGHVEAGLRSGNSESPYPEEMNRRLITQLATLHFAPTQRNAAALRTEGVPGTQVLVTGNPGVDSLLAAREGRAPSEELSDRLDALGNAQLIVLTLHRRESFGAALESNLSALRDFVLAHDDVALMIPVHPNPEVSEPIRAILDDVPRIQLLGPLGYTDFLHLLSRAWLTISDSGGIQEEACSLGKAVLVLRDETERREAVEAGTVRLAGRSPANLREQLEALHSDDSWIRAVRAIENPFGRGDSGEQIAAALERFLDATGSNPGVALPQSTEPLALEDFVTSAKQQIAEITPEEARRILDASDPGDWHFVDVREPEEFAAGHLPTARSSPRGFLEVRADLEHYKRDPWFEDRDRKMVLYCGGGHRSALAALTLKQMGFRNVVSLAEGWTGWTERDYPQER